MSVQNSYSEMTNEELLKKYQDTRDLAVKQELVMRYVYIVKSIALQMRDVYVSFAQIDDMINEGVLVIMNALDKFDFEKNVKFIRFMVDNFFFR